MTSWCLFAGERERLYIKWLGLIGAAHDAKLAFAGDGISVTDPPKVNDRKSIVLIGLRRYPRDFREMWLNRRTTYGLESYSVSPA